MLSFVAILEDRTADNTVSGLDVDLATVQSALHDGPFPFQLFERSVELVTRDICWKQPSSAPPLRYVVSPPGTGQLVMMAPVKGLSTMPHPQGLTTRWFDEVRTASAGSHCLVLNSGYCIRETSSTLTG